MDTKEDLALNVDKVYETFFDPLIQSQGFLTYPQFTEAFLNQGLVDILEIEEAFAGLLTHDEMLNEVRIRQLILQSMQRDDGYNTKQEDIENMGNKQLAKKKDKGEQQLAPKKIEEVKQSQVNVDPTNYEEADITGPVIFIKDTSDGGIVEIKDKDVTWQQLVEMGRIELEKPKEIRWVKTHEGGFSSITKVEQHVLHNLEIWGKQPLSKVPELKNDKSIYANYLHTSIGIKDRKFIAVGCPELVQVSNFWSLLLEENVSLVVCLTKTNPNSRTWLFQYWPGISNNVDIANQLAEHKMNINQNGEPKSVSPLMCERLFEIKKGKRAHMCRHIYYEGWPDLGVPKDKAQLNILVSLILQEIRTTAKNERVLIHCGQGIGRTGTIICIVNVILHYEAQRAQGSEQPKVSIFSILRRLREQRRYMVETKEQYLFIYEFLQFYLNQR